MIRGLEEKKRRNIFSRLFGRREKDTNIIVEESKPITESVKPTTTIKEGEEVNLEDMVKLQSSYTSLVSFTDINTTEESRKINTYRAMDNDAIISGALDLYADNSTQVNLKTGHIVSIESENKNFQDEINYFLWNIVKIDNTAWQIVRDVARDGYIYLDTKTIGDNNAWTFLPVKEPYNIQALTYDGDRVEYYLVKDDKNTDRDSSIGFFTQQKGNSVEGFTIEPRSRFLSAFATRELHGDTTIEIISQYGDHTLAEEKHLWVKSGRSYLASVLADYEHLSMLENSLFVNRLSKSKQFNVVHVDISGQDNKQAKKTIDGVKNAFKSSESISADRYINRQSPIPTEDFIYIGHRGEVGSIKVEAVGGDNTEVKSIVDIDYFRNKVFAGLGVIKAYLGFEETTPSGLGTNTLTQLDERFGRRVKRLQQPLKDIVSQMVEYYYLYSSTGRTLRTMPEYKIILGKVSTKEEETNNKMLDDALKRADDILRLVSDERFSKYVDDELLFNYLFNDVIGIDINNFKSTLKKEDVEIELVDIDETDEDFKQLEKEIEDLEAEQEVAEQEEKVQEVRESLKRKLKEIKKKKSLFNEAKDDLQVKAVVEPIKLNRVYHQDNYKLKGKKDIAMKGSLNQFYEYISKNKNAFLDVLEEDVVLIDEKGKEILLETNIDNSLRKILNEKQLNTYQALKKEVNKDNPKSNKQARKIKVEYYGIINKDTLLFFTSAEDPVKNAKEGKPTEYEVRVKLCDLLEMIEENVKDNFKETDQTIMRLAVWVGDLKLSCTCPASKYWGMQFRGTLADYSLIENWIEPTVNKPYQPICKHTVAVLTKALPFLINTFVRDFRRDGTFPERKKKQLDVDGVDKK